jgi:hypothetical protein
VWQALHLKGGPASPSVTTLRRGHLTRRGGHTPAVSRGNVRVSGPRLPVLLPTHTPVPHPSQACRAKGRGLSSRTALTSVGRVGQGPVALQLLRERPSDAAMAATCPSQAFQTEPGVVPTSCPWHIPPTGQQGLPPGPRGTHLPAGGQRLPLDLGVKSGHQTSTDRLGTWPEGRALAGQAQGPGFNPWCYQRKRKNMKTT